MYLTGFADEAAKDIAGQIRATQALGWKNIEARNVDGINLHELPENKFNEVCDKLGNAGIQINCFGSAIANWQKLISEPADSSYDEMKRAIPRMQKLGTKLVRIMSFKVPDETPLDDLETGKEVIKRLKKLVKMAEDGGVLAVHENCMNYGGKSFEHTLRLMNEIWSPNFKLVFDTGNPVFSFDIRGKKPYQYQNAWEFYDHVKDHVAYIHIKDGVMEAGKKNVTYTYPDKGEGYVKQILTDMHKRGYNGGISIEPHMKAVFHDESVKANEEAKFNIYIEYGKRMEKICADIGWKVFK